MVNQYYPYAKNILRIFLHFNIRPGQSLPLKNIWHRAMNEYKMFEGHMTEEGLRYAHEVGWLTQDDLIFNVNGKHILTNQGYVEATQL